MSPLIPYASAQCLVFNSAPASLDTWCHGTKLGQLWMEDGLSSDIAGGVEMILVTPGLPCTTARVCVRGTKFFVPLTSLLFVCPLIGAKTKDAVFVATKSSSFSGLLNSVFQFHLSIAWWRLWPSDKEGRTRDSREGAARCGEKQRILQIRFQSAQREFFYRETPRGQRFSHRGAQDQKQQMFPVRQPWLCKALGAFLSPISVHACINTVDVCYLLQQRRLDWKECARSPRDQP